MSEASQSTLYPSPVAATPSEVYRGETLMNWADDLTKFRSITAPKLGMAVALWDEGRTLQVLAAGSMATDYLDGLLARRGAEIAKCETRPSGAILDPQADKDLVNGLVTGLVGRFARQKHFVSAGVMGLNHVVSQRRDKRMDANRTAVVEHDLDPNKLKAIKINKLKTAGQFASLLALVGPNSERPENRAKYLALYSASTFLGLIGEQKVRIDVQRLIAEKEKAGYVGADPIPLFGHKIK